jgi:hypothetical protein
VPPASEIEKTAGIVPDSEDGLGDVPDEVVKQLEAAFVDLDGNANQPIAGETTLEDESTSPQNAGQQQEPVVANASGILALRQEEEESTQDLLQEAIAAGNQKEGGSSTSRPDDDDEMQGDQDKVCLQCIYLLGRSSYTCAAANAATKESRTSTRTASSDHSRHRRQRLTSPGTYT